MVATAARTSHAAPTLGVNVEAAAGRSIGPTKSEQFGWGGMGVIAPELILTRAISLEIAAGALSFEGSDASPPPGVAPTRYGFGGFATAGTRLRPLAGLDGEDEALAPSGLWIAGGFGVGVTGDAARPAVRAALGYDVATSSVDVGPFAGYFQLVEPDPGSLRPEDARVALVGVHGSFGRGKDRPTADPTREQPAPRRVDCSDPGADRTGCPEPVRDADADGVPDPRDACPTLPEDLDGVDDQDGCPDEDATDTDRDGIPDAVDKCPAEPETKNDVRDDDGCPDADNLHVDGPAIILGEHLHFTSGSREVDGRGAAVIAELATFLQAHPEYRRLRVQGHTDDIGPDDFNRELSRRRAETVIRRLIASGIAPERLHPEGLGEDVPIDPSRTIAARRANRRVQLIIEERGPVPEAKGE